MWPVCFPALSHDARCCGNIDLGRPDLKQAQRSQDQDTRIETGSIGSPPPRTEKSAMMKVSDEVTFFKNNWLENDRP